MNLPTARFAKSWPNRLGWWLAMIIIMVGLFMGIHETSYVGIGLLIATTYRGWVMDQYNKEIIELHYAGKVNLKK